MSEKVSSMQNVNALNNTNIPTNLNTLKGMIGKINNQIKTWNNNFKINTTTYINNINDENITNFINIYIKAQKTYNNFNTNLTLIHGHIANKNSSNNNILEGLYSNSENSLKIFQKRIDAQKALFINAVSVYINKTYIQALKNYTESLNNTMTKINGLKGEIDAQIMSNNLTSINSTYKLMTPNNLPNNKILKNNFTKLITTLKNFTNIKTNNTKNAFATYNNLYQTTSKMLKQNKSNMSNKIQARIKKLNTNINTKTEDLNILIASINAKISALEKIIKDNNTSKFKFTNNQKKNLMEIIDELNTSLKVSNTAFAAENEKLEAIVASLKKLIGTKNNGNIPKSITSNSKIIQNTQRISPPNVTKSNGTLTIIPNKNQLISLNNPPANITNAMKSLGITNLSKINSSSIRKLLAQFRNQSGKVTSNKYYNVQKIKNFLLNKKPNGQLLIKNANNLTSNSTINDKNNVNSLETRSTINRMNNPNQQSTNTFNQNAANTTSINIKPNKIGKLTNKYANREFTFVAKNPNGSNKISSRLFVKRNSNGVIQTKVKNKTTGLYTTNSPIYSTNNLYQKNIINILPQKNAMNKLKNNTSKNTKVN